MNADFEIRGVKFEIITTYLEKKRNELMKMG